MTVAPAEILPATAGLTADLCGVLRRHGLLLPLLRHLVIAEAVDDLALTDDERREALQGWCQRQGVSSQAALDQAKQRLGLGQEDLLWQAELPIRISRHCQRAFEQRAEQRFLERKADLDQVIYSLLRVQDSSLARELYLRIAEGEADFAELAARHALGPEQNTRGVIGPVALRQAHPALANLLRASSPGELHPPLQVADWWLVVRLEQLQPASFDAPTQQRMARELFEAWVEREVQERLAQSASAAIG